MDQFSSDTIRPWRIGSHMTERARILMVDTDDSGAVTYHLLNVGEYSRRREIAERLGRRAVLLADRAERMAFRVKFCFFVLYTAMFLYFAACSFVVMQNFFDELDLMFANQY
jgi:hypothetical protein